MPRTVTKPTVQTVESILKPHYKAGGITKKGINVTISITTARIQGNIYKALTLPTQGTAFLARKYMLFQELQASIHMVFLSPQRNQFQIPKYELAKMIDLSM